MGYKIDYWLDQAARHETRALEAETKGDMTTYLVAYKYMEKCMAEALAQEELERMKCR